MVYPTKPSVRSLPVLSELQSYLSINNVRGNAIYVQREIIPKVGDNHRFPTRFGNDLRKPRHRIALSEQPVTFSGPLPYSKLPHYIKMCEKESAFKKIVKNTLIKSECYSVHEYLAGGGEY